MKALVASMSAVDLLSATGNTLEVSMKTTLHAALRGASQVKMWLTVEGGR